MHVQSRELVNQQVCEVFERLAFMLGDACEKSDLPDPIGECFRAEIRFGGDKTGALVLVGPRELCPLLAANVLGAEPDDPRAIERSEDAMKEFLNVTCGHLLTAMAGSGPIFNLAAPTFEPSSIVAFAEFKTDEESMAFVIDDLPLLLRFSLEGSA